MVTILRLTEKTVSLVTGMSIEGFDTHSVYSNSPCGRIALAAEQPPTLVNTIMAVWGDTPTKKDPQPEPETPTAQSTPTIEQRTAALESAMLTMLGGVADV